MIITELRKQKLVIVGQHFHFRGRYSHRIAAINLADSAEIERLFSSNPPEDFMTLQHHQDEVVRMLVLKNLEGLSTLAEDPVDLIRNEALLIRKLGSVCQVSA